MLFGSRLEEAEGLYKHELIYRPTGKAPGSQQTPHPAGRLICIVGAQSFTSCHGSWHSTGAGQSKSHDPHPGHPSEVGLGSSDPLPLCVGPQASPNPHSQALPFDDVVRWLQLHGKGHKAAGPAVPSCAPLSQRAPLPCEDRMQKLLAYHAHNLGYSLPASFQKSGLAGR